MIKIRNMLIYAVPLLVTAFFSFFIGSYTTKHNNSFSIFLINNRTNILIGILTGIIASIFMTYGIYIKDMLVESDRFCRSVPLKLSKLERLLLKFDYKSLYMDEEIFDFTVDFYLDEHKYKKFILDENKKIILQDINILMEKIRSEIITIVNDNIFLKDTESEYKTNIQKTGSLKYKDEQIARLKENQNGFTKKLEKLIVEVKEKRDKLSSCY